MSRKARLEQSLQSHLKPYFLEVIDESANHHVPKGAETHFKLLVVSSFFEKKSRLDRQRAVHQLLESEFHSGLHALTMQLFTETEWKPEMKGQPSPNCRDGFDK